MIAPDATEEERNQHRATAGASATRLRMRLGDARELDWVPDASIHLVVISPPYWTLKKYNDHPDQLGDLADYEMFHDELTKVWRHCYRALVPGGRLVLQPHFGRVESP